MAYYWDYKEILTSKVWWTIFEKNHPRLNLTKTNSVVIPHFLNVFEYVKHDSIKISTTIPCSLHKSKNRLFLTAVSWFTAALFTGLHFTAASMQSLATCRAFILHNGGPRFAGYHWKLLNRERAFRATITAVPYIFKVASQWESRWLMSRPYFWVEPCHWALFRIRIRHRSKVVPGRILWEARNAPLQRT